MNKRVKTANITKELFSLFFPDCCPACGAKLLAEEACVCLNCLFKLPRTHNFLEKDNSVETRMAGRFPFSRMACFCFYTKGGILAQLIHQLKYHQAKEIGVLLGKLYGKDLQGSDFIASVDYIVPVPLHPQKQKLRGYNQAELIAQGLSESTHIPLSSDNLYRTISNPTQTKHTKAQRWENVKGIFDLKDTQKYSGKHILLVDDVITTGSTIEACTSALLCAPDIKLSVAALGEAHE